MWGEDEETEAFASGTNQSCQFLIKPGAGTGEIETL